MSRIAFLVFGVMIGAAGMFSALKYHVLRTNDGFQLVPKLTSNFDDSYVDIRTFDAQQWSQHKELGAALIHANKEQLMGGAAEQSVKEGVEKLFGAVQH